MQNFSLHILTTDENKKINNNLKRTPLYDSVSLALK